jgi:ribulose-5-phosphate 4-epimerase/fuculose-1-phosphate aldolase
MLEKIKKELVILNRELTKNNLVVWTGGNVSMRDPESASAIRVITFNRNPLFTF